MGAITDIEPGAFQDRTFRQVWDLEIRGTAITCLQRGALAGLNVLKSLSLYANHYLKEIQEDALLGFNLDQFTMEEQKQFSDLANVTQKIEWKYLRSLNLSKNSFKQTIRAPIFKGCSGVKQLILSYSEIEAIGVNAFEPMEGGIEILDLSNNRLKRLPSGLLTKLIRPSVQLYLSNNLWDCSCTADAKELQEYEINNPGLIIDCPLICESPPTERGKAVKNVPMECFSSSSSSTTTTTTTTYEPTEFPDKKLNYLSCPDHTGHQPDIALETEFQFFKITQEGGEKIIVEMNYPDSSLALVYVNDYDYHAGCQYNLKRRMEFKSVNSKAGYLFCLIKKSSYETSPRNCLPFHFHTEFSWSRDRILITLICSFALAIGLGLLVGGLFVCRYRRASRATIRQGSRDSRTRMIDELNIWSSYHHRKFFMHSTKNGTNLRSKSVDSSNVTPIRRSVSENSLTSEKTYLTPSPVFDVMQPRSRKSVVRNSDDHGMANYMDKLPHDMLPPPLPPLNNSRKENIYAKINGEYVPYIYLKRKY